MKTDDIRRPYDEQIAAIGQALAHPIRVQLLRLLSRKEMCGCEIAPYFDLDQSGISRHLNALRRAGLVSARRDGVRIYWRVASPAAAELLPLLQTLTKGTA